MDKISTEPDQNTISTVFVGLYVAPEDKSH